MLCFTGSTASSIRMGIPLPYGKKKQMVLVLSFAKLHLLNGVMTFEKTNSKVSLIHMHWGHAYILILLVKIIYTILRWDKSSSSISIEKLCRRARARDFRPAASRLHKSMCYLLYFNQNGSSLEGQFFARTPQLTNLIQCSCTKYMDLLLPSHCHGLQKKNVYYGGIRVTSLTLFDTCIEIGLLVKNNNVRARDCIHWRGKTFVKGMKIHVCFDSLRFFSFFASFSVYPD